jgi:sterol desaturase/sphingolipid hydroxylase (fatty acid hydroxylase superfamily)
MEPVETLVEAARQFWRGLIPGALERGLAIGLIAGIFYFLLVMLIERACGTRTNNYRSRGFAHDIAYYFYFRSGLQKLIVPAAVFTAFQDSLSFLDFKLLSAMPFPLQFIAWLLIADFVGYWEHRAKHAFRFLCAFHTTHHSQENVNFGTYNRVHPVEVIIGDFIGVILLLMLGAGPLSIYSVYIILNSLGHMQHTQIPWRLGPLYWVIVTPPFHVYHHSTNPEHHNKNFGVMFSFWDRLFGTAVKETSPPPTRFGLDDVKPTSLWNTLVTPFYLLWKFYMPARQDPVRR